MIETFKKSYVTFKPSRTPEILHDLMISCVTFEIISTEIL